jgi:glycosyltransferase involved in cell wall biosynthesis
VRALIDYRPALRERSGVGEYIHQLVHALADAAAARSAAALDLTVFSSSWKDRLDPRQLPSGVAAVDRRVPVRLLNLAWHRLGWPPVEQLAHQSIDIAHSSTPLILPTRRAATVVTIYDLDFLTHPERTRGEVRRDYPALARAHAHRADAIVVISEFTAAEVEQRLGVPRSRIFVCPPGSPDWQPRTAEPPDGYVLFFGTLEPRKNLGALLDAYELLIRADGARGLQPSVPPLVVAGKPTDFSDEWIARMRRPPLDAFVEYRGYVDPSRKRELYAGAKMLVMPSLEEGFGMPAVEAMALGVPVVVARRGALPEVVGDAGPLVDPDSPDEIARAIERLAHDAAFRSACRARGLARARVYQWRETARGVIDAYRAALEHHAHRR